MSSFSVPIRSVKHTYVQDTSCYMYVNVTLINMVFPFFLAHMLLHSVNCEEKSVSSVLFRVFYFSNLAIFVYAVNNTTDIGSNENI